MVSNGVYNYTASQNFSLHVAIGKEPDRRFVWDRKLTRVDYA